MTTAATRCCHPECLAVIVFRAGLVDDTASVDARHGGEAARVIGEVSDKDVAADAWLRENDLAPSKTLRA